MTPEEAWRADYSRFLDTIAPGCDHCGHIDIVPCSDCQAGGYCLGPCMDCETGRRDEEGWLDQDESWEDDSLDMEV